MGLNSQAQIHAPWRTSPENGKITTSSPRFPANALRTTSTPHRTWNGHGRICTKFSTPNVVGSASFSHKHSKDDLLQLQRPIAWAEASLTILKKQSREGRTQRRNGNVGLLLEKRKTFRNAGHMCGTLVKPLSVFRHFRCLRTVRTYL